MKTIGQIAELFNLPISTLRYYDKEGLFPDLQRKAGIRHFGEPEIEALRVIECLKKSGMEIKDIKRFMEWCKLGSQTYPQRKALFDQQEIAVKTEMDRLEQALAMIKFKQWYYEQALRDGHEERLATVIPQDLPAEIKSYYALSHPE